MPDPLPRGRHSLDPDVVAENQRTRILDAVAAVAAEQGHGAMTVDEVVRRARVSRSTFYERFESKEAALLAAVDMVAEESRAAVAAAFLSADEWPEQVRRGGWALFKYMLGAPTFARLACVEMPSMGPAGLAYREASVASFELFLAPGFALTDHPPPASVARMIGAGVWATIEGVVARDEWDQLLPIYPGVLFFCLVPFLGTERAALEAERAEAELAGMG